MAFFQGSFHSSSLGMDTSLSIVVPESGGGEHGFPVLYLLHGLSDDHSCWVRRTSIERYALEYGLAVVMPAVQRSFYVDMHCGLRYAAYVGRELPEFIGRTLRVSLRREDTFIAGLSMGGYGAWRTALNNTSRFSAAASLSGALDLMPPLRDEPGFKEEMRWILGDPSGYRGSDNDIYALIGAHADDPNRPRLYQCCGRQDFLIDVNRQMNAYLKDKPYEYVYVENEGVHDWAYWDYNIQAVLRWLFAR